MDINRSTVARESRHGPRLRQNRMIISSHLPSQDDLKKMKFDKKVCLFFFILINLFIYLFLNSY